MSDFGPNLQSQIQRSGPHPIGSQQLFAEAHDETKYQKALDPYPHKPGHFRGHPQYKVIPHCPPAGSAPVTSPFILLLILHFGHLKHVLRHEPLAGRTVCG